MTWGGGGFQPVPDGTTWDDTTGRTWTVEGTGATAWSGSPAFHVYTKNWTGSAWSVSWTEVTGTSRRVEAFNTRRGVRSWWEGMQAGSATIDLDYTGGESGFSFTLVQKVRLTVDVPSGEQNLFTGFVINTQKTFNAAGYPVIRLQLVDHVAWSAQQVVLAASGGPQQTGYILRALISTYGAGIEAADYTSISTVAGLSQVTIYPAGNLMDLMNQYIRGELGVLWVDAGGVFQWKARGWWYPQVQPTVASIGSTDRGSGGFRNDPPLTENDVMFPASISVFQAKVTYTSFTWYWYGGGPSTAASTTGGIGSRQWTDNTLLLNAGTEVTGGLNTLSAVLPNFPLYTGVFDDSATVTIHAEMSDDSLNYCATADVTDFVQVAKETQADVDGRWWVPAHVMGISHSFNPSQGWDTTLDLELGLAEADYDPFPG